MNRVHFTDNIVDVDLVIFHQSGNIGDGLYCQTDEISHIEM